MATARKFAAVLGLTAMAVVFAAGIWRGGSMEGTLLRGLISLLVFGTVGYVCGWLGGLIMRDAVRTEVGRLKGKREARGGSEAAQTGQTGEPPTA